MLQAPAPGQTRGLADSLLVTMIEPDLLASHRTGNRRTNALVNVEQDPARTRARLAPKRRELIKVFLYQILQLYQWIVRTAEKY